MTSRTRGLWLRSRLRACLGAVLVMASPGCLEQLSPEPGYAGVSRELARSRKERLSDLTYHLRLVIPASMDQAVSGTVGIRFRLSDARDDLVIDFKVPPGHLESVRASGRSKPHHFQRGQIVLPAAELTTGENELELKFSSSDLALNRQSDFLYSLFVPDRASTVFPCFDQPDLKARFLLELDIPAEWEALSNAAPVSDRRNGSRREIGHAPTRPLSTYQFAIAAGRFEVSEVGAGERDYRVFHRETDQEKLKRNLDSVATLHSESLRWLEEYTAIPYAFEKFDIFLVPSFQFGGMEHPGAIYYRDSTLLLEQSATQADELGRASLIAHETAHMWFGNLVTMPWFDDVWMKEVFANFMAAKAVNPSFPEIDHELRFLLAHHPAAYGIDRTLGTHPILQPLDNLNFAASLYGPIIYQKAPVVMRQLEDLIGDEAFRQGMHRYLSTYQFGNAGWKDLVEILDPMSGHDLAGWSRVWVEEAGRPEVAAKRIVDAEGRLEALALSQRDPWDRDRVWAQGLVPWVGGSGSFDRLEIWLDEAEGEVWLANPRTASLVLPASGPLSYGLFRLDGDSLEAVFRELPLIESPSVRALVWLTLWDALLEGDLGPERFAGETISALASEDDDQIYEFLLNRLEDAFWRLGAWRSTVLREQVEDTLWLLLEKAGQGSRKTALFRAWRSMSLSAPGLEKLSGIWSGSQPLKGLVLGEEDRSASALELALKSFPDRERILAAEEDAIENPDRAARFRFVRRSVAGAASDLRAFHGEVLGSVGRVPEPWILNALGYLHHPLRGAQINDLIREELELIEQVESQGSIFFPQRWLHQVLWGADSEAAARVVEHFLRDRSDLPRRLRLKVLQASDLLFRITGLRPRVEEEMLQIEH